jgi:hypothetical protein
MQLPILKYQNLAQQALLPLLLSTNISIASPVALPAAQNDASLSAFFATCTGAVSAFGACGGAAATSTAAAVLPSTAAPTVPLSAAAIPTPASPGTPTVTLGNFVANPTSCPASTSGCPFAQAACSFCETLQAQQINPVLGQPMVWQGSPVNGISLAVSWLGDVNSCNQRSFVRPEAVDDCKQKLLGIQQADCGSDCNKTCRGQSAGSDQPFNQNCLVYEIL